MRTQIFVALVITLSACGRAATQAPLAMNFQTEEMARFDEPWAMTFLPDGRALVTERGGSIKARLTDGRIVDVLGAPKVAYRGQGGLGDVVAHPEFAKNGLVYLSWAEAGPTGSGAAVGRALLVSEGSSLRLKDLQVIWRQAPKVSGSGHFGHRIAFGPDLHLYISSGERQKFDPAQDLLGNLGKIVRLKEDGTRPDTNPFRKAALPLSRETSEMEQIWSLGHRNPLGLAFDGSGRLWEIEMGPMGGDELNLIKAGGNYGWPRVSNGTHYDGRDIPDHGAGDGFEAPKVWWNPSISPSSLMIYSGTLFPAWKGDAFVGALSGQALIRIKLSGDTARKAEQWDMSARIREVEQGPDGAIWILEDGSNARLLRLRPKS
jgi:aldose sugar dehydrogenase